jgi:hypothetical protein
VAIDLHQVDAATEPAQRPGLTARALAVGCVCVAVLNVVAPYSEWIVRSTLMTTNYFPLGLAFSFIAVTFLLNPFLKSLRSSAGLSEVDLGVIYVMLLAAASVPTYGITGYILSVTASTYYFATPENGWADYLHDAVPTWAVPADGQATAWFFEGRPPGADIPWDVWIVPLGWWGSLVAATLAMSIALIVIFRAQWVDSERLGFPLVDIPAALMNETSRGALLPAIASSRLFWSGFAVTFLKIVWAIPSYFFPQWPTFGRIRLSIKRGKVFPGFSSSLTLPLLGISYFVHTDVLLSIWVFNLWNLAEIALFNRLGFTIGSSEIYSVSPSSLAWQGFGAFSALVAGGIWVAREHLGRVWRRTRFGDLAVDDSNEMMGYRAAVVTILVSALYILLWLHAIGIALPIALLLLYAVITLYLGLTRIVVEGGLVFVRGPLLPQAFAMHTVGPLFLSSRTMTGLALSYGWACDPIVNFMPFGANAARIHSEHRVERGALVKAMALGLVISLVVSFWFSLRLAYDHGGFNFGEWVFRWGGRVPFDTIVGKMQVAEGVRPWYYIFFAIGIAATIVLTRLRHRFIWWRLHPIGFSIASVGQVRGTVLTLFFAWLIKTILIRIGGLMLYDRAKPFFVGLAIGHFAAAGLSFLVDVVWFQGYGHSHYY